MRHHQGPGHVLVGVRGGPAPVGSVGSILKDVPIHQPVTTQMDLLVFPQSVEQGLVVHVNGDQHSIRDAFRHGREDGKARIVGPLNAQIAARSGGSDAIGVPNVIGGQDVRVVVVRGANAVVETTVLRKRIVGGRAIHASAGIKISDRPQECQEDRQRKSI